MKGRFRRFLLACSLTLAVGTLASADLRAEGELQVDEAKLDSFVDAYRAVHEVASSAMEEMQAVKTDEEFEELQSKLEPQFEAAIEGTEGITFAEFREIEAAAIEDEVLGQRIVEKMQVANHAQ